MNVIPLYDRIIVRPSEAVSDHDPAARTIDPTEDRPMRGMVIAAGTGAPDAKGQATPLAVQAGDTILFGKHLGRELTFGGLQYWIMKADDVMNVEVRPVAVVLYGNRASPRP
jgi:chaperonin GroES